MKHPLVSNLALLAVVLAAVGGIALLLHLQERAVGRYVAHRLGWRGVLLTGWIGVPIHELGHLMLAVVFRHRIVAWKLFDPDPVSGTLGYVRHARSRHTLWQRIGDPLIAIAPLLSGGAALAGLTAWIMPSGSLAPLLARSNELAHSTSIAEVVRLGGVLGGDLLAALWEGRGALLPLQLYLCIAVACHAAPSRADLASGLAGVLWLLLAAIATAVAAAMAGASIAAVAIVIPLATTMLVAVTIFQLGYVAAIGLLISRRGHRGRRQPQRAVS